MSFCDLREMSVSIYLLAERFPRRRRINVGEQAIYLQNSKRRFVSSFNLSQQLYLQLSL